MAKYRLFILLSTLLTFNCATTSHKDFYSPSDKVYIFEYFKSDINLLYNGLFKDLLIIGESGFKGEYEEPDFKKGNRFIWK